MHAEHAETAGGRQGCLRPSWIALRAEAGAVARALGEWPPDAWPLFLEMVACNRWTYIPVTDPDHRPLPASDEGGQLAEHGRGLSIVDHLAAARWVTYAEHGKTVHVVMAAPEVAPAPGTSLSKRLDVAVDGLEPANRSSIRQRRRHTDHNGGEVTVRHRMRAVAARVSRSRGRGSEAGRPRRRSR